jgi:hypothetical protein
VVAAWWLLVLDWRLLEFAWKLVAGILATFTIPREKIVYKVGPILWPKQQLID